jgi:hypothetical protein
MKPNAELAFKVGELGVYAEYMTSNAKQQLTDQELTLSESEWNSNVALIKAAPELLKFAQELVAAIKYPHHVSLESVREIAEKVIAKATGSAA